MGLSERKVKREYLSLALHPWTCGIPSHSSTAAFSPSRFPLTPAERIGADPRNLTWSTDTSRFSYKHMTALGWSDQKGIGAELQGNPNHIAVSRKQDNGGIGMGRVVGERQEAGLGAGSGSAGRGFEDVLKRLAAAGGGGGEAEGSASPSPGPSSSAAPDVEVGAGSGLGTTHRNA